MQSKKRNIGFVAFICLAVSSLSYGASTSEASVFNWDYRSFCNTTVPSYVDAYVDGDREIVIFLLSKNEVFKSLNRIQQEAFIRILDYYYGIHSDQGIPIDQLIDGCVQNLNAAIEEVDYEEVFFCSDVSKTALRILDKEDFREQDKDILRRKFYYECIKKINVSENKDEEKRSVSN